MKKIAIIISHPIQYHAPLFQLLNERKIINIKVFYTWGQAQSEIFDPVFGHNRKWDIPLIEGYEYNFVKNVSTDPGSHHFKGIINPTLIKEIETWGPDAVLVFGWSFKSHLNCIRFFHKKLTVLFRGDSTLLDEKAGVKLILRRLFLYWVYRHIDYALYVGQKNKI